MGLGKILFSIPHLYRNSRDKKGATTYGSLSVLAAYKVLTALIILAILFWGATLLKVSNGYLDRLSEVAFLGSVICGLIAFLVLIITFLIAKLNRFQHKVERSDILDDSSTDLNKI
ncbi:MAG: hypothetical protein JKY03_03865 [Aureispira sp.]|nr:hypothetical protein [Aureispira sp.]